MTLSDRTVFIGWKGTRSTQISSHHSKGTDFRAESRAREKNEDAFLSGKGLVKKMSSTLGTKEQLLVDTAAGAATAE